MHIEKKLFVFVLCLFTFSPEQRHIGNDDLRDSVGSNSFRLNYTVTYQSHAINICLIWVSGPMKATEDHLFLRLVMLSEFSPLSNDSKQ